MPEGDTVHKLARALRPELEGRRLRGVWLRDRGALGALAGRRVHEIATLGKHMLLVLRVPPGRAADDAVLHVHLGMHGRWRRAAGRDVDPRPPSGTSLQLATDAGAFVCHRAARAELLRRPEVGHHPALSRLGPDLLVEPVAFDRIVARARSREPRVVADLLLDQSVACGLGNAYKSDVLFLEGVHPRTPTDGLSDAHLESLFRRAAELLAWNLGGWRRTTTRRVAPDAPLAPGEPRHWVYGRAHAPCLRCGTHVASARVGDAARATWWCPRCQPEPGSRASRAAARSDSSLATNS